MFLPYRSQATTAHEEEEPSANTPAMRQYFKLKETVPGYILLFQMGDFFELFYEDALVASSLLDLTLTSRHKGGQRNGR